jgi:hypothetical protein
MPVHGYCTEQGIDLVGGGLDAGRIRTADLFGKPLWKVYAGVLTLDRTKQYQAFHFLIRELP